MGTDGSAIKEKKTVNENEDKDYNPENLIIGERRVIPFNEINRILEKVYKYVKI